MFEVSDEMKVRYLSRRQEELIELNAALTEKNYEPAIRIGHILKGNGSTFGFDELSDLGKEIEEAGENQDEIILKSLVNSLQVFLQKAQNINH